MTAPSAYLRQHLREYAMMAALIIIVVAFQALTGGKLLIPNNVASLVQQNAYVVVAFVGGAIGVMLVHWDVPWILVVVLAVMIGALVGCWQGFWVAYVGIPAFIVTLAGMLIFRGLAIAIAGTTISGFPEPFKAISKGSLPNALGFVGHLDVVTLLIGGIAITGLLFAQVRARVTLAREGLVTEPVIAFVIKALLLITLVLVVTTLLANSAGGTPIVLIIVGALVLIYTFVLKRTVFGRHIYARGGNLQAAILSGVNTKRVDFLIFVNMGLLAGIAAVITTARAGSAVASAGVNFELDAIAAAFIGGTAVTGGIGKVSGAIIGALIMGVLNMGLSIMGVDAAWQQTIKGLVLLAAVAFDVRSKRKARTS